MFVPILFFSSPQDWGIIIVVALVLFGAKRLPEMARGLGEGMKEFKKAVREVGEDETPVAQPVPPVATPTVAPTPSVTAPMPQPTAAVPRPETPEEVENRIVH